MSSADRGRAIRVVQVNYAFDEALDDPDALLARYTTLTGWGEALAAAGAGRVSAAQRFWRDVRVTRNGIDYIFCRDQGDPRPRPWTWPRKLHQEVAEAQPDIVHVNGLIFPVQPWLLRQALPESSAIVVQDHGSHAPPSAWSPRDGFAWPVTVRKRGLGDADAFLFSAAGQEVAWQAGGFIAPTQQVYHVMEASTTLRPVDRHTARRASGVDGSPAVLWVGRLNANKDPLTVLDGFEMSLDDVPDATLTMVYSTNELWPAVHARVQRSPALQARVRLVGQVPHELMQAFYSAADLFVLGSHHEGSGYALLEACACGAVPVVTRIPSFRAITGEGTIGALWGPGDARACADAIVQTARCNPEDVRPRVVDYERWLGWPAIGRQAIAVYEDVWRRDGQRHLAGCPADAYRIGRSRWRGSQRRGRSFPRCSGSSATGPSACGSCVRASPLSGPCMQLLEPRFTISVRHGTSGLQVSASGQTRGARAAARRAVRHRARLLGCARGPAGRVRGPLAGHTEHRHIRQR